jgi:hypothetical protein
MGQFGLDSSGSKQGQAVGCCEHGDEPFSYHIFQPVRRTAIFSLEFYKNNNDECILILVIYWKKKGLLHTKTGLLHTKISNHNIIYSS